MNHYMFIQIFSVILCLELNHVDGSILTDLCPNGECSKGGLLDSAMNLSKNESKSNKKCDKENNPNCILDAAVDLIYKAIERTTKLRNMDCGELLSAGFNRSGVYTIWPRSRVNEGKPLNVYCDMETDGGGWTVIQRRGDFGTPNDYFYRGWLSYKYGFGDIKQDFWLGNDNIFTITNQKTYSVRVDLKAVDGEKGYALYETFWIEDEFRNYTLHLKNFSGNASDQMTYNNKMVFSTKDAGITSCAQGREGAWWYAGCTNANLNGLYLPGEDSNKNIKCAYWSQFKGSECLKSTEIKIKQRNLGKKFENVPL